MYRLKGQGQTADLHPKCCLLIILWSFVWMVTKLATLVDFREKIILIAFWVTRSKFNYWSLSKHCSVIILWTICLIITRPLTVVANSEWIIHCIYATFWDLAPGGGGAYVWKWLICSMFRHIAPSLKALNAHISFTHIKTAFLVVIVPTILAFFKEFL